MGEVIYTGAGVSSVFLQKVDFAAAEFIRDEDSPDPRACTQPAPRGALPEAALITLNDYTAERCGPST